MVARQWSKPISLICSTKHVVDKKTYPLNFIKISQIYKVGNHYILYIAGTRKSESISSAFGIKLKYAKENITAQLYLDNLDSD